MVIGGAGGGTLDAALLFLVAVDIAALVSVWRSPVHSRKAKGLWTGIVVAVPLLGAIGWFALGREGRR